MDDPAAIVVAYSAPARRSFRGWTLRLSPLPSRLEVDDGADGWPHSGVQRRITDLVLVFAQAGPAAQSPPPARRASCSTRVGTTTRDRSAFGLRHVALRLEPRNELPPQPEAELQSTWNHICDLDLVSRTKLWGAVTRIHGVVERVRSDEGCAAQEFVAR